MRAKLYKSLWEYVQFVGTPLTIKLDERIESHLERIAQAGYAGIESPLPCKEQEETFVRLLQEYNLEYIAQVLTSGEHSESFELQARRAAEFHPLKIVSHSAADSMPYEAQLDFFRRALDVEKEIGLQVAHETHRGRAMFTPWNTAKLLREFDGLKITADFSHWCCVCESLLHNQEEHLTSAIERTIHIHGRIGYAEGPQVSDPRAPEYANELERHVSWWKRIAAAQAERGFDEITFTPEFGPPGYMQLLPYTRQPVVDLWETNLWMGRHFRKILDEG
jgi:sugar phosphate isomerase/epimerase